MEGSLCQGSGEQSSMQLCSQSESALTAWHALTAREIQVDPVTVCRVAIEAFLKSGRLDRASATLEGLHLKAYLQRTVCKCNPPSVAADINPLD